MLEINYGGIFLNDVAGSGKAARNEKEKRQSGVAKRKSKEVSVSRKTSKKCKLTENNTTSREEPDDIMQTHESVNKRN
ncbi:hypothetical protein JCGZ_20126 [Jatropha curcas]|uniref:Uncharacterized protein n=1 Tax=Jatropha curcas TaxID=180498 RepID=A0A067K5C5_JATCU|nr:hypothetical protein JCGZ_20126 [Jatropha curcas]